MACWMDIIIWYHMNGLIISADFLWLLSQTIIRAMAFSVISVGFHEWIIIQTIACNVIDYHISACCPKWIIIQTIISWSLLSLIYGRVQRYHNTKSLRSSWCKLYHYWQRWKWLLWQTPMPLVTTKLVLLQALAFCVTVRLLNWVGILLNSHAGDSIR